MIATHPSLVETVRQLLLVSTTEVFSAVCALEVKPAPPDDLGESGQELVAGSIGFIGDLDGHVYFYVTTAFARTLTSRMLGLAEEELEGDEMIHDAIGELSNMVVGSVKSHLCDSGAACVLTIPAVMRGQRFSVEPLRSAQRDVLHLQCGENRLQVEWFIRRGQ